MEGVNEHTRVSAMHHALLSSAVSLFSETSSTVVLVITQAGLWLITYIVWMLCLDCRAAAGASGDVTGGERTQHKQISGHISISTMHWSFQGHDLVFAADIIQQIDSFVMLLWQIRGTKAPNSRTSTVHADVPGLLVLHHCLAFAN